MTVETYNTIDNLAFEISETYREMHDKLSLVGIVGKHDDISKILKIMCTYGYSPRFVHLHDEEWDGYNDEFFLSLFKNEVSVEPLKHGDKYYSYGGDVIYALDNCSMKVLSACDSDDICMVSIKKFDLEEAINNMCKGEFAAHDRT